MLQPGGRMSVSDIVIDGDLLQPIRRSLDAWASCLAGALDETIYLDRIRAAGFEEVEVLSCDYADPDQVAEGEEAQAWLDGAGVSTSELAQKVASIKVRAYKPQ